MNMNIEIVISLKRRQESADEGNAPKKLRNSREQPLFTQSSINILCLSDYTLLCVFQYLDATSLYYLSKTCERFHNLITSSGSLWVDVNARGYPNSWAKNRFVWENVHKNTRKMLLAANRKVDVIISVEKLIAQKIFPNLTILALEHQCIKYCKLNDFPNTLQELSLRWSFIPRQQEFFRFALHAMAQLKTLILDHCKWLEVSSFMAFCRFPSLEILSLYMCTKLGDDDVSTVGVAARGFKNLKVADLRFTCFGDLFLRTFYGHPSLQIVYLQNFPATYYMERWQRKMDILEGARRAENSFISDDEDNNITKRVLCSRFKTRGLVNINTQTVTNFTAKVFNRVSPSNVNTPRATSVLYKYPYPECSCGYIANHLEREISTELLSEMSNHFTPIHTDEDPSDDECPNLPNCWDKLCLERKLDKEKRRQRRNKFTRTGSKNCYFIVPRANILCGVLVKDSCAAPQWCHEEATPDYVVYNWMHSRQPRNEFEIDLMTYADKHFRTENHSRCQNCGCVPCETSIVVVQTNNQGQLEQVHRIVDPTPAVITPNIKDEQVVIVIHRMVEFIGWIKRYNYTLDPERVLRGFVRCLDIGDLLAPAENRSAFVAELADLLIEFAKNNQNIYFVLRYHTHCFRDFMIKLIMCKTDDDRKKYVIYFFQNLVNAEKIGNDPHRVLRKNPPSRVIRDFSRSPSRKFESGRYGHNNRCGKQNLKPASMVIHTRETQISELSFRGFYHISDSALQTLGNLNLKLLDVTGTNVTVKGIKEFKTKQPNCRVIHESACVCRPALHF